MWRMRSACTESIRNLSDDFFLFTNLSSRVAEFALSFVVQHKMIETSDVNPALPLLPAIDSG